MPPVGEIKKAIGAFLTSLLTWGYMVVQSEATQITAEEWLGLAGVVVTTITVYFLDNKNVPADGGN